MKVINPQQFKTVRGYSGKPIIRFSKTGIALNETTARTLFGERGVDGKMPTDEKGREYFHIQFAENDGQLFLGVTPPSNENSVRMTLQPNCVFEYSSKGLSEHLRTFTNSGKDSVPCLLQIQAKDEDGWIPIITTYWKTLN